MSAVLAEMFRHNTWATLELLNFCRQQEDSFLDGRAPAIFGSARDTMIHVVAAERRYASGFQSLQTADVNEMMGKDASFALLLASARETGDIFIKVAAEADQDWAIEREYAGEKHTLKGSTLLIQAIDHATEHRTQVRDILTEQGLQPPVVDGWTYSGQG
ncbi:MAG TPA: DinB family protein [Dehalococcoidia bacterium]|nr:DinB family protein [Dehalococcoidia bacterium]